MRANFDAIGIASIKDELCEFLIILTSSNVWFLGILRGFKDTQKRLDHMVSMSILIKNMLKRIKSYEAQLFNPRL